MQETFKPIWNDKSLNHIRKHNQYKKESNGYCLQCQRPLQGNFHYLCPPCIQELKLNGLEYRRVGYKEVGNQTINYQQHLHRLFFKCNAPYNYRGIKENRIKTNIKEETIDKMCIKLDSYLSSLSTNLGELYHHIKDLRNTQRRLLYGITLYSIAYNILEYKGFKHKAHYQASISKQLENDIKRMYIRTHTPELVDSCRLNSLSQYKHIYKIASDCTNSLVLEVL